MCNFAVTRIHTFSLLYCRSSWDFELEIPWASPSYSFIPPTYTTYLDKAYHNFPNHNVPFFPLAGPRTRGVALITPGNNRSGWDEVSPDISKSRGSGCGIPLKLKALREQDSREYQTEYFLSPPSPSPPPPPSLLLRFRVSSAGWDRDLVVEWCHGKSHAIIYVPDCAQLRMWFSLKCLAHFCELS